MFVDEIRLGYGIADPGSLGCVERPIVDLDDIGRANTFDRQVCLESRDGAAPHIGFPREAPRADQRIGNLADGPQKAAGLRSELRVGQEVQIPDDRPRNGLRLEDFHLAVNIGRVCRRIRITPLLKGFSRTDVEQQQRGAGVVLGRRDDINCGERNGQCQKARNQSPPAPQDTKQANQINIRFL